MLTRVEYCSSHRWIINVLLYVDIQPTKRVNERGKVFARNPYIVVDVLTDKRRDLLYQLALILNMGGISQHGPLRVGIGIGGSNIAGYIQQRNRIVLVIHA